MYRCLHDMVLKIQNMLRRRNVKKKMVSCVENQSHPKLVRNMINSRVAQSLHECTLHKSAPSDEKISCKIA